MFYHSSNQQYLPDINLKTKYQPDHVAEDYLIESILYRSFIDGRLVPQESKLGHHYSDLQKIWRQKVKEIKAKQAEEQKQTEAQK